MTTAQHVTVDSRWTLRVDYRLSHISVYVPAGTTGTITEATADLVALTFDDVIEGLEDWDNSLVFTPEDALDYSESLDPRTVLPNLAQVVA